MKLSELLVPGLVLLPLEADDKWRAIGLLARRAVEAGHLHPGALGAVEDALLTRERSMTTGMEHGIAIPHAAVDGIPEVVAVLGISRRGIPFDALDGEPARIVVCLVIPRDRKLLHIKTLAEIAKLLSRAEVRRALCACDNAEQVVAAIRDAGG
jgi:mannitol/fructose-specific phosphotransferase system IIA component (Ntr-type)